ncbi:zinc finger CCHC domain-containing 9-like [Pelobates cultripes]|uniref:Zinc finger CCHC domain-containing 9-like n=1 Tax=Pelobates cultripes TaxID=61616 RepID=A0AAD1SJZ0_PELCU|nr:zinc finger CCHC domain-containing 9-like [Pelobates cultripes]
MYDTLRNLLHPEKPASKPLASLITLLTSHFQPKPLEIAERFKFYKRRQEPGESVSAYAIALRKLASTCCFGDYLHTALRDQFVMGIASDTVLRGLLTEEDLTFTKAMNMASIIEQASKDANLLHSRLDNTQEAELEVLKLDARARSIPQGKKLSKQEHSHYKCYRCGAATHVATTCRFKDAKCHACGKMDHLQRVCKSTAERGSNRLRDRAKNAYRVQMQESSEDSDEQFPVRNVKNIK